MNHDRSPHPNPLPAYRERGPDQELGGLRTLTSSEPTSKSLPFLVSRDAQTLRDAANQLRKSFRPHS